MFRTNSILFQWWPREDRTPTRKCKRNFVKSTFIGIHPYDSSVRSDLVPFLFGICISLETLVYKVTKMVPILSSNTWEMCKKYVFQRIRIWSLKCIAHSFIWGYSNEVGEAFRSIVPVSIVRATYVAAFGYVCADALDKSRKAHKVRSNQYILMRANVGLHKGCKYSLNHPA